MEEQLLSLSDLAEPLGLHGHEVGTILDYLGVSTQRAGTARLVASEDVRRVRPALEQLARNKEARVRRSPPPKG